MNSHSLYLQVTWATCPLGSQWPTQGQGKPRLAHAWKKGEDLRFLDTLMINSAREDEETWFPLP